MRAALATCAAASLLAGCGVLGGSGPLPESGPGIMGGTSPSVVQAQGMLRRGGSTKAQVAGMLGPANVIAFDSGWEVWVYRWPGAQRTPRAATELVLLFDRGGLLRKDRVRAGIGG